MCRAAIEIIYRRSLLVVVRLGCDFALEHEPYYHLQEARIAYSIDRAKAVLVSWYEITAGIERQISRSEIGQTSNVQGSVDTAELRVVQRIEGVHPQFKSSLFAKEKCFL